MLNLPVTPQPWAVDALCAQTDPDLFFPTDSAEVAAARRVCADCPVRQQCLADALADPALRGIWGGTTRTERRRLLADAA